MSFWEALILCPFYLLIMGWTYPFFQFLLDRVENEKAADTFAFMSAALLATLTVWIVSNFDTTISDGVTWGLADEFYQPEAPAR